MTFQDTSPARITKRQVPTLYRLIAPTHDLLARIVESEARSRAIEWAAIKNGETILDVAVGTGLNFQHALRQNPGGFNTGIDLTPAMLDKARKRTQRIIKKHNLPQDNFVLSLGDAYKLDFPDNHFDLLLNSYMFDLLPLTDFVPVLSEFKRVLKPGGRIVQINMTHGEAWYNHIWEGLYRIHPFLLGGCRTISAASYLTEAGFKQVEREYISQRTFPSEILRAYSRE